MCNISQSNTAFEEAGVISYLLKPAVSVLALVFGNRVVHFITITLNTLPFCVIGEAATLASDDNTKDTSKAEKVGEKRLSTDLAQLTQLCRGGITKQFL